MSRRIVVEVVNDEVCHRLYHVYDGETHIAAFVDPYEAALCKAATEMFMATKLALGLTGAGLTFIITEPNCVAKPTDVKRAKRVKRYLQKIIDEIQEAK